ncbi:unnamed protein product [Pedinophyceae sp. YPF-701]|nr:unnamed protein product [Pedinophyceae sp. YPF-701]
MGQQRQYDITVFGSTGFTGKRILKYLLNTCASRGEGKSVAAAGRNEGRLKLALTDIGAPADTPIVIADVSDEDSLAAMAASSRVVISAVGPYRLYGQPVISACVKAGCDYLDVCGEPEFLERAEHWHDTKAKETGSVCITAAGFDSVPAELGCLFAADEFRNAGGQCSSVTSYISVDAGAAGFCGHFATYESAVLGFASANDLRAFRKQRGVGPRPQPGAAPPKGPGPDRISAPAWRPRFSAYAMPFPGADASVVRRTMAVRAARGQPAVKFVANFLVPSAYAAGQFVVFGGLFGLMARFAFGRSLLLRHPGVFTRGLFSRDGPSEAQMAATTFCEAFVARGTVDAEGGVSEEELVAEVRGPEPGYVATPIFVAEAALTLLEDRQSVLDCAGGHGVHTAGVALHGTSYVRRLVDAGISFEVKSRSMGLQRAGEGQGLS